MVRLTIILGVLCTTLGCTTELAEYERGIDYVLQGIKPTDTYPPWYVPCEQGEQGLQGIQGIQGLPADPAELEAVVTQVELIAADVALAKWDNTYLCDGSGSLLGKVISCSQIAITFVDFVTKLPTTVDFNTDKVYRAFYHTSDCTGIPFTMELSTITKRPKFFMPILHVATGIIYGHEVIAASGYRGSEFYGRIEDIVTPYTSMPVGCVDYGTMIPLHIDMYYVSLVRTVEGYTEGLEVLTYPNP